MLLLGSLEESVCGMWGQIEFGGKKNLLPWDDKEIVT
jgi:hypothetical protein